MDLESRMRLSNPKPETDSLVELGFKNFLGPSRT